MRNDWNVVVAEKHHEKNGQKLFIICKRGNSYVPLKTSDLIIFYSSAKSTFAIDSNNNKYIIDKSLHELEEILDKDLFFRVNRQIILNINSIKEFRSIEFGKIAILLKSSEWIKQDTILVSQITTPYFKEWINNL